MIHNEPKKPKTRLYEINSLFVPVVLASGETQNGKSNKMPNTFESKDGNAAVRIKNLFVQASRALPCTLTSINLFRNFLISDCESSYLIFFQFKLNLINEI